MAFLPKLEHDLFISYAHEDQDWGECTPGAAGRTAGDPIGAGLPDLAGHQEHPHRGQYPEELYNAIRASAASVAVISRNYPTEWCEKELAAFLTEAEKDDRLEKLFQAMQRGLKKVFVACAAQDASEERESLIKEIRAAGYAISPSPSGVIAAGLDRKRLKKFIDDANVSVHLLGAVTIRWCENTSISPARRKKDALLSRSRA